MDVREVGPLDVGTHERGGALQMSAALAMAEGAACVKSAGEAEKAITAKSEALEPRAYDKAGRRERPPQGGAWHGVKTSPQEGEQEGYVRTWGKSDRGELTSGHRRGKDTSGTERKRPSKRSSKGHSPSGDRRGKDTE